MTIEESKEDMDDGWTVDGAIDEAVEKDTDDEWTIGDILAWGFIIGFGLLVAGAVLDEQCGSSAVPEGPEYVDDDRSEHEPAICVVCEQRQIGKMCGWPYDNAFYQAMT